jgi:hypothetical protein
MRPVRHLPVTEALIVVAAIGAVALAAYFGGRVSQAAGGSYDTFSTYDAASGGYRAWYELLQREGIRVARFERRPAFIDSSVDVYVMSGDLFGIIARAGTGGSAEQALPGDWSAVAKWVHAGGHLVWLADGQTRPDDLNIPDLAARGPRADDAVTVAPSPVTAGVASVSGTARLRAVFGTSAGAAPLVADDIGGVVVSYPLGRGAVTVVTDESLFENARLARADNARLGYDLATYGLTSHGTVAFDEWSHGYVAGDTWWTILPRPFQVALIVIGAALLLLVVATALRFGPTVVLADASERTSAEYLSSMAALYSRGGARKTAIDDLAGACLREVAAAAGLPETAAARSIAVRLGGDDAGPAEDVMELDRLRSYEYPHPADLLRAARLCAALRKEFIRHGHIGIRRRTAAGRRTA